MFSYLEALGDPWVLVFLFQSFLSLPFHQLNLLYKKMLFNQLTIHLLLVHSVNYWFIQSIIESFMHWVRFISLQSSRSGIVFYDHPDPSFCFFMSLAQQFSSCHMSNVSLQHKWYVTHHSHSHPQPISKKQWHQIRKKTLTKWPPGLASADIIQYTVHNLGCPFSKREYWHLHMLLVPSLEQQSWQSVGNMTVTHLKRHCHLAQPRIYNHFYSYSLPIGAYKEWRCHFLHQMTCSGPAFGC